MRIETLRPGTEAFDICARWRHDAFLADFDVSFEEGVGHLHAVDADPGEAALVASEGEVPLGLCLLVRNELDPVHDLTPWLASLYVHEPYRGRGIGRALVRAVEDQARSLGHRRVHLYTDSAEQFYAHCCGWSTVEHFDWDGHPCVLMHRDL